MHVWWMARRAGQWRAVKSRACAHSSFRFRSCTAQNAKQAHDTTHAFSERFCEQLHHKIKEFNFEKRENWKSKKKLIFQKRSSPLKKQIQNQKLNSEFNNLNSGIFKIGLWIQQFEFLIFKIEFWIQKFEFWIFKIEFWIFKIEFWISKLIIYNSFIIIYKCIYKCIYKWFGKWVFNIFLSFIITNINN